MCADCAGDRSCAVELPNMLALLEYHEVVCMNCVEDLLRPILGGHKVKDVSGLTAWVPKPKEAQLEHPG